MHVLLLILLPLLLVSLWVFASYLPVTSKQLSVQRYNRVLAIVALLSPIGVTVYFWQLSLHHTLTGSWPIMAILASIFVFAIILLLGTALRAIIFDRDGE